MKYVLKTQIISLKWKNLKQIVSSQKYAAMTNDQNKIVVDSHNFEQGNDSKSNMNSSKVCRKKIWHRGNKIERFQTDDLLTVMEILGYLLYRGNCPSNRDIVNIAGDTFNNAYSNKLFYEEGKANATMHQVIQVKNNERYAV